MITKVDFSTELAAAESGQCLLCRIGGTHRLSATSVLFARKS